MNSIYQNAPDPPQIEAPPPRRPPPRFDEAALHDEPARAAPPAARRRPAIGIKLKLKPDEGLLLVGLAALWLLLVILLAGFLQSYPPFFPFYAGAGIVAGAITGAVLGELILRRR